MTGKLHTLTATELTFAYRRLELSPLDVVHAVLEHIERRNPELNAFALLDADAALTSARASEARWLARKPNGLLDGVPVSVKDLLLARGWQLGPSRVLPPTCRYQPSCSAFAIEALEKHGAIKGGWMALRRLMRCHPWGGHGYDPVP